MFFVKTYGKEVKLKDITTNSKGKGISKSDITTHGIPCVRYGELYTSYNEIIKEVFSKTNLNDKKLVKSQKGDILIPSSGESALDIATASCLLKENVLIGGDITILKTSENPIFLTYYLNHIKKEIAKYAQGVSIVHLYYSDFKNIKLHLPPLEDQEKIANFLSLIDEKLVYLKKTYSLCQTLKKYYLSLLVSFKLRFNEFKSSPLENNKLGDICKYYSSNLTINKIKDNYGDYAIYGADGIIKRIDFFENENPYITIVKDGAGVGRLNLCKPNSSTLSTLGCLIPNGDFNINFIYYMLQNKNFKKYVVGSTIPHLYFKDYSKENILTPSITEQNKISCFLLNVDKKVDLLKDNLNELELFKKEMLNKLFI